MHENTVRAKTLLSDSKHTCVLCKDSRILYSDERGVLPLLKWIQEGTDVTGFHAADRVVGKAAAFLYVKLKVAEVYAPVMSKAGADTLMQYGIRAFYDTQTVEIRNRDNTDICPMDKAVKDAKAPQEAFEKIREQVLKMRLG